MMPNSDQKDRFVYPIQKRMFDSFSCILFGASARINSDFTLKFPGFKSAILYKIDVILKFCDVA